MQSIISILAPIGRHRAPVALLFVVAMLSACSHQDRDVVQGYVEGEYVYLASSQSGELTQLSVARGQTVQANAPLFALESVDETAALQQAQQQLAAARAQLADIQTGKRPPEINVNRAQLAEAVANARKASLQLARDEAQFRAGGIAKGAARRFTRQRRRNRRASPRADESGGSRAPSWPFAADHRADGAGGRGAGRSSRRRNGSSTRSALRRRPQDSSTTRCIATANGCRRAVPWCRCCRRRT